MSPPIPSSADGDALAAAAPADGGWRRRRRLLALIVLLVAVAAVVLVVTNPFAGGSPGGVRDNAYPRSVVSVKRQSLASLSLVSGTLGYTGDVTVALPAGSAPAMVTQARQAVTTDQGTLASARSTLSGDSAGLSQARAALTADQQQESIECAGDNAAQNAAAGGAGSGAGSGACGSDAQLVASGQQSVSSDAGRATVTSPV